MSLLTLWGFSLLLFDVLGLLALGVLALGVLGDCALLLGRPK